MRPQQPAHERERRAAFMTIGAHRHDDATCGRCCMRWCRRANTPPARPLELLTCGYLLIRTS
jgi:hypothetical protein